MSRETYPGYGREGSFCHMYCEIAMEAYYQAMQAHAAIKARNYSAYENKDYEAMNKHIVSTVVFSAMAIESFLNDYAAACLGDNEFYDNFDRLSVLSKFQLIAKFIIQTPVDKGQAYYSLLKSLFSNRDRFVHNKSRRMKFQGYPEELMEEIEQEWLSEEGPTFDLEDIRKDMRMGLDALKAMRELARFFDERDDNVSAQFHFFGSAVEFFVREPYQKEIFKLLKIPVEKI